MKKISVIIPVYNAEKTLRRCFDSIIAQTYPNFEVIAVNDESADQSFAIMQEYERKDSRFHAYAIGHAGVSAARNEGLKYATGEYLQFVDADDDLDPEMHEKLIRLLEENDADLAVCRFRHPFFKTYYENRVYDLRDEREFYEFYQDTYGVVMPWNRIWRRECFTVPFDLDVHFSEDELGNLANLPAVRKAVTTDEYLYHYYFAKKEDNAEEKSCVNEIINSEAFWNNKASFYFLGGRLVPKRTAIIEKGIAEGKIPVKESGELRYLRLIDYSFWQMPAYIGMGIPEFGMAEEFYQNLIDPDFVKGMQFEERFGFRLKQMTEEEKRETVKRFVNLCYRAHRENPDGEFRLAYSFITLFLVLFTEVTGELDSVCMHAKFLSDFKTGATKEARYVQGVLA